MLTFFYCNFNLSSALSDFLYPWEFFFGVTIKIENLNYRPSFMGLFSHLCFWIRQNLLRRNDGKKLRILAVIILILNFNKRTREWLSRTYPGYTTMLRLKIHHLVFRHKKGKQTC